MTPRDLIAGAPVTTLVGSPEMDPLTEKDALACAPLVEAVFEAVKSRVGLLFDLRVAEQLRTANTGLIVFGGVEAFDWRAERRPTARTSWNVDSSVPGIKDGVVNLKLIFFPNAVLTVTARSAAFFAGDVSGLPEAPPDFAGNDTDVAMAMASIDSPFKPIQATFFDPLTRSP